MLMVYINMESMDGKWLAIALILMCLSSTVTATQKSAKLDNA